MQRLVEMAFQSIVVAKPSMHPLKIIASILCFNLAERFKIAMGACELRSYKQI
jgi:hypothetical protein